MEDEKACEFISSLKLIVATLPENTKQEEILKVLSYHAVELVEKDMKCKRKTFLQRFKEDYIDPFI